MCGRRDSRTAERANRWEMTRRGVLGGLGGLGLVGATNDTAGISGNHIGATQNQFDDSWPQFQYDMANTSHVSDAVAPVTNIQRRWLYEKSGDGTPAVVDDTIFAPTFRGVSAISADDGAEKWHFDVGDSTTAVAVVDGSVYFAQRFSDSSHHVYSLAADDGTEEWRFETDSFVDFIRSPPTVADGAVYFGYNSNSENNPHDELGGVYAVSTSDGQQLWHQVDPRDGASSTVGHAVAVVDETVYVGPYALSTDDGSPEWTSGPFTETAPSVSNGTLYCGQDDGIVALSATDGSLQWQLDDIGKVMGSPAVANGRVYFTDSSPSGLAYAVNADDGSEIWQVELGREIHYGPIVANNTVYIAPINGPLFAVSTDNGEIRWKYNEDGRPNAAPVIVDSTLYYQTNNGLHAITGNSVDISQQEGQNKPTETVDTRDDAGLTIFEGFGDNSVFPLAIVAGGVIGGIGLGAYRWLNDEGRKNKKDNR